MSLKERGSPLLKFAMESCFIELQSTSGRVTEAQNFSLSWLHGWSDRLSTTLSASIGDADFERSVRSDDRESYSVGVNYDWQRWLSVGAKYT